MWLFILDLCPLARLPSGVLPGQKGSGPVHSQLVWGSEQLPAHSLPGHRLSHPAPRCHPPYHLVAVWYEQTEHEGVM